MVGRNAARLGLSKARYLVGLVERDAAGEADKGPFMALSPDEQRALLAAVRAIHALMTEDAPGEEDPARQSGAASPGEEPAPAAPESGRPEYAAEPLPDSMAPDVADPETGGEAGLPDGGAGAGVAPAASAVRWSRRSPS